jgi:ureidoglycolate dehydrogenase (NAD+)
MEQPTETRVPHDKLQQLVKEVFVRCNVPEDDANIVAETLVVANLRGVDSHGVLRVPMYAPLLQAGRMNPRPNITVTKETASILMVNADRSLGPVVTVFAMNKAIEKASATGIGCALIRATAHQGSLGYYPLMAVKQNMIGIIFTATAPIMAYFGSKQKALGNNPLAIAVPGNEHDHIMLDMATSVVAIGKIMVAADKGMPIPEGWALDQNGDPTTDPAAAIKGLLLPFGGPKGSGLALIIETMASLLAANSRIATSLLGGPRVPGGGAQNSIVMAIDIATFCDVDEYKKEVDRLYGAIKGLQKASEVKELFLPGEIEYQTHQERLRDGIPLPAATLSSLKETAESLDVGFPF